MIESIGWSVIFAGIGVVLFAGVVRGFTGFGYSAISIALLSFLIEPRLVVPLVLMMEVAASAWMLRAVWGECDFKWLGWTLLGMVVGTPIGVWALSYLPAEVTKTILYITLAILALAGFAQSRQIIPKLVAPIAVVGLLAGIGNGLAGVAGMIAALFMISANMKGESVRASMVLLFFFADIYALVWNYRLGLLDWRQVQLLAIYLIPLFVSISAGSWGFRKYGAGNYKNIALGLIFGIALLGLSQIIFA